MRGAEVWGKSLWMSDVGRVLRNLRDSRGVTRKQFDARSAQLGQRLSASMVAKVELGQREVSSKVVDAYVAVLLPTNDEIEMIRAALEGRPSDPVTVRLDHILARFDQLDSRIAAVEKELTLLRGEIRGALHR